MEDGMSYGIGLVAIAVVAVMYFAPAIVAFLRGYHNRLAIGVLNALLGWTGIGWVASLIWSLTQVTKPPVPGYAPSPTEGP